MSTENLVSEIKTIGIIGSGQMGAGIAQTAAQSGFHVLLCDQNTEIAKQALARIATQLQKSVEKQKITAADASFALEKIQLVSTLQPLVETQLVIEAVSENADLKFKIFRNLDEICAPHTLFASNTSSISITAIAAQTKRPQQVAGMHFMNPVPVMKLVEGIRGLQTSALTFSKVRAVAEKMNKVFIEAKDQPGFAVNRILMPMINEAITALHEGIATKEDIDSAMTLGTNQPMGPLTLADFIGLDTCLAIMEVLHQGLGDSKYRPSPLLRQYVAAGWLGRKTKQGFYQYGQ